MSRYRDRESGEFVSEATYNRSVAQGGTRYEEIPDSDPDSAERIDDLYDLNDFDYEDYGDYEIQEFAGSASYKRDE